MVVVVLLQLQMEGSGACCAVLCSCVVEEGAPGFVLSDEGSALWRVWL